MELLDADLTMVLFRNDADRLACEGNPLFARLDSVRQGGYVPLDSAEAHAFAFPTVLSLDHIIDRTLPRLASAVAS